MYATNVALSQIEPKEDQNWILILGKKFGENSRIYSRKDSRQQNDKREIVNISVYHAKLYGENPWILAEFYWENPNGFLHLVSNFCPSHFAPFPEGIITVVYNSKILSQ